MSRSAKTTSGGKAVGGGALSPRSKHVNSTFQVDGWRRGGGAGPIDVQYFVISGAGGAGAGNDGFSQGGAGGGGGGFRSGTIETALGVTVAVVVGGGGGHDR